MRWISSLFGRRRIFEDLSEEIQQHLEEKTEALVAAGLTRSEATQEARRRFGNVSRIEERGRLAWMWPRLEQTITDIRFALRRLQRSPGFALTAVVTLALGIGANVFVLSLLNSLILKPGAEFASQGIVQISHKDTGGDFSSYRDFEDIRDQDPSFRGVMAYRNLRAGLRIGASPIRSWGYAVSGNYFDVLGVTPVLGHMFHGSDDRGRGSAPYMVISEDLWRRQFGADRKVIGHVVQLNGQSFSIVAVAPRGFRGTDVFFWPDYWIPVMNTQGVTGWDDLCCRDHLGFSVLGRLKPGVTVAQATASLGALARRMANADSKDKGLTLRARLPGAAGDSHDPMRRTLWALELLAGLVLLAACANLASIFTVRANDRTAELAVRLAIGSGRWTLAWQLLTESVLLSFAGGIIASAFAALLLRAVSSWQPFGEYPTRLLASPDVRVYSLAVLISVASGVLFGLLPVRLVWRTDVVQALKAGYREGRTFRRVGIRDALLLLQIVVCTLLVTASLVSVRGIRRALHAPLGFTPQGITLAQGDTHMAGYTGNKALVVQKGMLVAAQTMPGMTAAALADSVPFLGGGDWFIYRDGTTEFVPAHMAFDTATFAISPEYLQVAGTPLLAGRNFTWHDEARSPLVAIVNETFAQKLFGSGSAVGQHFSMWQGARYEVVGVVADGRYEALTEAPRPMMLVPFAQGVGGTPSTNVTVLVRSRLPQNQTVAALQQRLANKDPEVPLSLSAWDDAVDLSLTPVRAASAVLGVMGGLAAVLAGTGIFGMAAYAVSTRRKEQGIRMALGAQRVQVAAALLKRPVALLLCGSVAGVGVGLLLSGLMAHLIAFATPHDPFILLGVLVTMTLLGVAATWVPARRALAIHPAGLLRE